LADNDVLGCAWLCSTQYSFGSSPAWHFIHSAVAEVACIINFNRLYSAPLSIRSAALCMTLNSLGCTILGIACDALGSACVSLGCAALSFDFNSLGYA
jgi:hypothetical protein